MQRPHHLDRKNDNNHIEHNIEDASNENVQKNVEALSLFQAVPERVERYANEEHGDPRSAEPYA